jgi:hypothetical protein
MINFIVMDFILHNNYHVIQYIFLKNVPEEIDGVFILNEMLLSAAAIVGNITREEGGDL